MGGIFSSHDRQEAERRQQEEALQQQREQEWKRRREEALQRWRDETLRRHREEALQRWRDEALQRQREEAIRRQREEALRRQREEATRRQLQETLSRQQEEAAWRAREASSSSITARAYEAPDTYYYEEHYSPSSATEDVSWYNPGYHPGRRFQVVPFKPRAKVTKAQRAARRKSRCAREAKFELGVLMEDERASKRDHRTD